jgi:hypothetical protein
VIKVFSLFPDLVESVYSTAVYRWISYFLRILTCWIPFSTGDIVYFLAGCWIVWKIWRLAARIYKRKLKRAWFLKAGYGLLIIGMMIYILFNILWGINYNRRQLSDKLNLAIEAKDTSLLRPIGKLLLQKVNQSKKALVEQKAGYPTDHDLFERAAACYEQTEKKYPFLSYHSASVKRSMFGLMGNYFGFTGYYNPFSGEAQVNTRIPKFILPYTATHEIAHQLGYAKEEEANFAGYLAATTSTDTLFHYSAYLDLFVYANRQLFFADSAAAKELADGLLPEVKADIKEWREFLRKHKNPLEPVIRWAYGNYLRANQQPKGITSYDEVIADLIAFYKKYGRI